MLYLFPGKGMLCWLFFRGMMKLYPTGFS